MRDRPLERLAEPLQGFARQLNDLGWSEPASSTWRAAQHILLTRAWLGTDEQESASSVAAVEARLEARLPSSLRQALWPARRPPDSAIAPLLTAELPALQPHALYQSLLEFELEHAQGGGWQFRTSPARRHAGAHYTPQSIADAVVRWTLQPLVEGRSADELLELRVCDPTMGAGIFLAAAATFLAEQLSQRSSRTSAHTSSGADALEQVCARCICGIDRDPTAVVLARLTLWELAGEPKTEPRATLVLADALLDRGKEPVGYAGAGLDFDTQLASAFTQERRGFDAIVGNPPWVAYVGRATQPLAPALKAHYAEIFASFKRYRTLHGVFAERCATLLQPGGRLGLVLPTSMADLAGYEPTRQAHDRYCVVDEELPDLGDGRFAGVFQPCMVLLSTRRAANDATTRPWRLSRDDLDPASRSLLTKLASLQKIPSECFGERGYQTTREDKEALLQEPDDRQGLVPLRSGTEIGEFRRGPPRYFADPTRLSQKLRPAPQWRAIELLIRQTARYPIAAASDGLAFRNSIIAGFAQPELPAPLLLSYLNSNLVRWFHYHQQRDARQGMPQLKVGHLRELPCPPSVATDLGERLLALGAELTRANGGCAPEQRRVLDTLVYDAFSLTDEERATVDRWALACPPPRSRLLTEQAEAPPSAS